MLHKIFDAALFIFAWFLIGILFAVIMAAAPIFVILAVVAVVVGGMIWTVMNR